METRANHILIGVFATLVLLGAFGFIMWLSQVKFDHKVNTYDIIFTGSVTGVGPGGDVRYNGLKYGEVKFVRVKADDPSKVLVRVELDQSAPVTTDTKANLETLSVTGVSVINLVGTKPGGTRLVAGSGEEYPVIHAQGSSLQDLFKGLPEFVARANGTLDKLDAFLADDNATSFKNILRNTETFTASIAKSGSKLDSFLANADQTAKNLDQLVKQTGTMVETTSRAVAEYQGIAADNRAAIADFAHNGLGEISRFAIEARALVHTLDRLADHLDSDPQSLIYGPGAPRETKRK